MMNCENSKIDLLWIIVLGLIFIFGTGRGTPVEGAPTIIIS